MGKLIIKVLKNLILAIFLILLAAFIYANYQVGKDIDQVFSFPFAPLFITIPAFQIESFFEFFEIIKEDLYLTCYIIFHIIVAIAFIQGIRVLFSEYLLPLEQKLMNYIDVRKVSELVKEFFGVVLRVIKFSLLLGIIYANIKIVIEFSGMLLAHLLSFGTTLVVFEVYYFCELFIKYPYIVLLAFLAKSLIQRRKIYFRKYSFSIELKQRLMKIFYYKR